MDAELTAGFRWVEVAPPGSDVVVAIVAASGEYPTGVDTGIRFVSTDAAAEHASMREHGVSVGELLRWPGVPTMFSFRDPDGNTFYLTEAEAEGDAGRRTGVVRTPRARPSRGCARPRPQRPGRR